MKHVLWNYYTSFKPLVNMDVKGPTPVASHLGYKYWAIFIDYGKFKVAILMKRVKHLKLFYTSKQMQTSCNRGSMLTCRMALVKLHATLVSIGLSDASIVAFSASVMTMLLIPHNFF